MNQSVRIACWLVAAVFVASCTNERPASVAGEASSTNLQRGVGEWAVEKPVRASCMVTIQFGSFAVGPDRKAAAIVDRVIRADSSVTEVTRSPYEREGEYSLCVRTGSRDRAIDLFEALREALRAPVRAPVLVRGPLKSFSAPVAGKVY